MPRISRWTPVVLVGGVIPIAILLGAWMVQSMNGATTADVRMTLNGRNYLSALGDPVVRVRREEVGFNESSTVEVFLPLQRAGNRSLGLTITIEPDAVIEGEPMVFGNWADDAGSREARAVRVEYTPFSLADLQRGVELVYSSGANGGGEILFDTFEPEVDGTVSGTLVRAELNGRRWSVQADRPEDGEELLLVIEDLAFEGTVVESEF